MVTLEEIISYENMHEAMTSVIENKGAPGVDGIRYDQLEQWFRDHPHELTSAIINGSYKPSPIRRVYIPKENGERRPLGIPSVVDRVVQQAIAQVLSREYDETFSEFSYGFRPDRSAHQAVKSINNYLNEGYTYVVDLDISKFFDTVSHGKILRLLSEKIKDGRVISLINKILTTKIIDDGKVIAPKEGLTQGAPCSPILANILLDILDKELERRNHKFARYADDVIIVCKSRRGALRTFDSVAKFIERKLLLKINLGKSKVQKANATIKFLGFAFYAQKNKCKSYRPIVHRKSKSRLVTTLRRQFLRKNRRSSIEDCIKKTNLYLLGWTHYFALGITRTNMNGVEAWIRRKIRAIYLKAWKRNATKEENFIKLGTSSKERCHIVAHSSLGVWAKSKFANFIITKDVIHKVWGWLNISDIAKSKKWTILGY